MAQTKSLDHCSTALPQSIKVALLPSSLFLLITPHYTYFFDVCRYPAGALKHRAVVARNISEKNITNANLQAVMDYVKKVGAGNLNEADFKSECGLGVVVTKEEIKKAVADLLASKRDELNEKRFVTVT